MSNEPRRGCLWNFPPLTRNELRCTEHGDGHTRILLWPILADRSSTLIHVFRNGTLTGEALAEAETIGGAHA